MQNQNCIKVPEIGVLEKGLDIALLPIKHIINITDILVSKSEYAPPRRTSPWNWVQLDYEDASHLDDTDMVFFKGDLGTTMRHIIGMPLMFLRSCNGSWNDVKVLEATEEGDWFIGWISGKFVGLSCIRLQKKVCMLLGPGDVYFFGIRASDGMQMPIVQIAEYDRRRPEEGYSDIPFL